MISHMNLNHARLPISPHPHIAKLLYFILQLLATVYNEILSLIFLPLGVVFFVIFLHSGYVLIKKISLR